MQNWVWLGRERGHSRQQQKGVLDSRQAEAGHLSRAGAWQASNKCCLHSLTFLLWTEAQVSACCEGSCPVVPGDWKCPLSPRSHAVITQLPGERSDVACSHGSKEISVTGSLSPYLILRILFLFLKDPCKGERLNISQGLRSCEVAEISSGRTEDNHHKFTWQCLSFKHRGSPQDTMEPIFWRSLSGCLDKKVILCFLPQYMVR